jgi:hypothetical protein
VLTGISTQEELDAHPQKPHLIARDLPMLLAWMQVADKCNS